MLPRKTKDDLAYEAYVQRMKALDLPAADRRTYMNVTKKISNYSTTEMQHKRAHIDKALRCVLTALMLCVGLRAQTPSPYVTLQGVLQGPNGLPLANNVISLTPTQPFYVVGSGGPGGYGVTNLTGNLPIVLNPNPTTNQGTIGLSTLCVNSVWEWNGTQWNCVNTGGGGGSGAPNQAVSFTNATSATITVSSSTVNILWDCYDNNSPANAIAPTNVYLNLSTYVVTFNFAVAQSGYCVVNSSGGGGGSGPTTNPGTPTGSFQWNSGGSFAGTVGAGYTAGAGNNPGVVSTDDQNGVITVTSDFNFSACATGCTYVTSGLSTISAGSNTVTLTPVPIGINGTDIPNSSLPYGGHYLMITPSGTDPTPITEYVLITGGTAVSGASSGTLTFTAAYAHASGYLIGSASTGLAEAAAFGTTPGGKLKLVPHQQYTCYAPVYFGHGSYEIDGQWAFINDASFNSCLVIGGGPWGTGSTLGESIDVHSITFLPDQTNWSVQPTGSLVGSVTTTGLSETGTTVTVTSTLNPGVGTNNVVVGGTAYPNYNGTWSVTSSNSTSFQFTALVSGLPTCTGAGNCGTAALTTQTVTIPTCPSNFYAAIPNQQLWVAGTSAGSPTTAYGYGEYAFTQGGTCTPGLTNGTVILAPAVAAGFNGFGAHDHGYTLSNGVNADIEDTLSGNGHFHDLRWEYGTGLVGVGIQVNADEATGIDNINMGTTSPFRGDSDFQGAGVFTPGGLAGAAILNLGPNVNISGPSICVKHYSGNDFNWSDGICQNYGAGGVIVGRKRGNFGVFTIGPSVHFEVGGNNSPWNIAVGNPQIMVVGGGPVNTTQGSNGEGLQYEQGAAYPEFVPTSSPSGSQTYTQFYYLVAHTNASSVSPYATSCSPDCVSPPIFIGAGLVNSPAVNNVTVVWYGWGANATSGYQSIPNPSTYDLLAVQWPAANDFPQVPTGTGLYAVATGLSPASICNLHNICTYVDTLAPASRTSYSVTSTQGHLYQPLTSLLPGIVSASGNGQVDAEGTPSVYTGPGTCLNTMEGIGTNYVGTFTSPISADVCPAQLGPISRWTYSNICIQASGTCSGSSGSGIVAMLAGTTSIAVTVDEVTPYSRFKISEDSTQGALLGVTCNTTPGRTYTVTAKTPGQGGGFTITSNAAPTTNPACLDWEIVN